MAEGGWSSGTWGEAGWGMSVYYRDAAETATTADTEAVAGSTFLSAIVATAQGVDNIATTPTFFVEIEEEAGIGSTVQVAGSDLNVSLSEATAVSDANSAQQVFACDIADTVATADSTAAQQVFSSAVDEAAAATDSLEANFAYFSDVSETVVPSEAVSAQHVMPVSVSEAATALDNQAATAIFQASVSESAVASVEEAVAASIFYAYVVAGATIADTLAAQYLWELIDDNEDANWQNVNDAQSPGWAQVETTQSPDWQQVAA